MRQDVPALFHGRGILCGPGFEMALLCSNQMGFDVGSSLPISIRGEIWARQNVAGVPAGPEANCTPALLAAVCHLFSSLGKLATSSRGGRTIASLQSLSRCGPAKLRSPGPLKSGATADWGHALSQLRDSIHTLFKVSGRAALTQSRNSGNNLQLSEEKSFRRSGISTSRIQVTPSNDARRRIITRPHHFKLAPLG